MSHRGLIRDAASAAAAAEAMTLLHKCSQVIERYQDIIRRDIPAELWAGDFDWDMAAVKGTLEHIRGLISGETAPGKKGRGEICKQPSRQFADCQPGCTAPASRPPQGPPDAGKKGPTHPGRAPEFRTKGE